METKVFGYPAVKSKELIYYSDNITEEKQLNTATTILGINRNTKMVVETVVDIMTTQLNDTIINFRALSAFAEIILEDDSANIDKYFFASGSTIGTISHRVF